MSYAVVTIHTGVERPHTMRHARDSLRHIPGLKPAVLALLSLDIYPSLGQRKYSFRVRMAVPPRVCVAFLGTNSRATYPRGEGLETRSAVWTSEGSGTARRRLAARTISGLCPVPIP